jgi:hypothetical protein
VQLSRTLEESEGQEQGYNELVTHHRTLQQEYEQIKGILVGGVGMKAIPAWDIKMTLPSSSSPPRGSRPYPAGTGRFLERAQTLSIKYPLNVIPRDSTYLAVVEPVNRLTQRTK